MLLKGTNHGLLVDEAGDIVDMTIRVVPRESLLEPDDMTSAQEIAQILLHLFLVRFRIYGWIQKTLLRRQNTPGPIDVDCATFQNDTWHEQAHTQTFTHEIGNVPRLYEPRILASPRIESPLYYREPLQVAIDHK